jgi:hypothetical protein
VSFENLHGPDCRADLPADDALVEQFGHPILDREGVGPRAGRGVGRRERNGAARAPGFRQRPREIFERLLH